MLTTEVVLNVKVVRKQLGVLNTQLRTLARITCITYNKDINV